MLEPFFQDSNVLYSVDLFCYSISLLQACLGSMCYSYYILLMAIKASSISIWISGVGVNTVNATGFPYLNRPRLRT